MKVEACGQVGPSLLSDGVGTQPFRQGKLGEQIVQQLHGRFYEQNVRGAVFSGGMGLTAITNVIWSTQLDATSKPIVGVWNPSTSPVNLVILQAFLGVAVTAATALGGAPFVWATSVGNSAISTGSTPLNRKTLIATGSFAKDMSGIALTGMTGTITVKGVSALGSGTIGNFSQVGTAVGFVPSYVPSFENIDGAWIVPPGGVLALFATTTPVAHSAASMIVWEEVPI
jgi:hypothetical protein